MKGKGDAISLPEVELNNIADYYTLYVGIFGISEEVFWYCDIGFIKAVAANQQAFRKWMNRQIRVQGEQKQKKRRKR